MLKHAFFRRVFVFALLMALGVTGTALAAVMIPSSVSSLSNVPAVPDTPQLLHLSIDRDGMEVYFDRTLPAERLIEMVYVDRSGRTGVSPATYDAQTSRAVSAALPSGCVWRRLEVAWVDGENGSAVFSTSGNLVRQTVYDRALNGYVFNKQGTLIEYQQGEDGVFTRFDARGRMESYSYRTEDGMRVWFDIYGSVLSATYEADGYEYCWTPADGWYVESSVGRISKQLSLNPRSARPLKAQDRPDVTPTPKPDVTWFPNNTIGLAGLSLREANQSLPDKWYNVIPVDLTHNGRHTYYLIASNARFIGECYVDIWYDDVTVTCEIMDRSGIELLSEYGRWFTALNQINTNSIEASTDGFIFGQPVSRERDLRGADVALLFIRSKCTYRQPFADGSTLTTYWRNKPDWITFRKDLLTLMPYVEAK